ncbi:uncharacterized protein LOC143266074 [Megachile rotundata]|uniref:uncharacterized protein LOC143266074 n=1 Tax=Megachile rotundata TaxID=143995 RepID=UPI003FD4A7FD
MAELVANQTYIMRSEFQQLHNQLINTTVKAHRILNRVATLAAVLQETQAEIKERQINDLLLQSINQLDRTIEEYGSHLIIIIDAILFARQGVLHPAILLPQQLLKSAKKIRQSTSYDFPLTPAELLAEEFSGITELQVAYSKGRVLFELVVPLLDTVTYDLYKKHPNPLTEVRETTTVTGYIKPKTPYIAVSTDGLTYITLSEEYLQRCCRLHGEYIGSATISISNLHKKPTCETELLNHIMPKTWKICDIRLSFTLKYLWQPLKS